MENVLKIAIVQSALAWENPEENRINFTNNIITITEDVDIIVLPEMFTTGFTMNATPVAETMSGDTISWMQKIAQQKNAAITGSVVIKEHGGFFNRLLFVHPNGNVQHYDKRHTFTLAGEDKVYAAGSKKLIIHYKGWSICPLVCYDLRFPVWSRNTDNYEVLIYVANWPKVRTNAWDALLKARAIENMSYCIGVNRIGKDGNGHDYIGHSAAYDVLGNRMDSIQENSEAIEIVSLSKTDLETLRGKLNFLRDRDRFDLE
ncbi:MAG TPA: amidohydrolase [Aquaticitalea sp.]|nr:amidohydrolase [Aquaticitalea sp.]